MFKGMAFVCQLLGDSMVGLCTIGVCEVNKSV